MAVEPAASTSSPSRYGGSHGKGGRAFVRVLAARRTRRPRALDEERGGDRDAAALAALDRRVATVRSDAVVVSTSGVDVAARVERLVLHAVERARAGDPCRVETSVTLRDGEVVDVAVRATAREVEIRIVAPTAVAADIRFGRARLLDRLASRGVRVRACEVSARLESAGGRR